MEWSIFIQRCFHLPKSILHFKDNFNTYNSSFPFLPHPANKGSPQSFETEDGLCDINVGGVIVGVIVWVCMTLYHSSL
jgi:hypothetical protein